MKNIKKAKGFLIFLIILSSLFSLSSCWLLRGHQDFIPSINLSDYEPFAKKNRTAKLKEPSTFKLTENLPRLDGATAFYPVYAAFAEAVYPKSNVRGYYSPHSYFVVEKKELGGEDSKFDGYFAYGVKVEEDEHWVRYYGPVLCNTTSTVYQRIVDGDEKHKPDIIFVFGPTEEQLQYAEERGVELEFTTIGREAFVFFVNPKNPVDNLSVEDIKKIYSGEATNWSEFGGRHEEINPYQRSRGSGSQMALIELMGETPIMAPKFTAPAMGDVRVIDYEDNAGAIGYSYRFFITDMMEDNTLKMLSIDGVAPTKENILNGTYPLCFDFYAVTAGSENPNVEPLIEWILSEQGQYLIEKTGYVSIRSLEN